jgi:hypothetical protein
VNAEEDHNLDTDDTNTSSIIGARIKEVPINKNTTATKVNEYLNDLNWTVWHKRIVIILRLCKVLGYINGTIKHFPVKEDPLSADVWTHNDMYTIFLIICNIELDQMIHINGSNNFYSMWNNLIAVHKSCGH